MCDLIKRKDVLNIIHDYFGTVIDERTDKYKEGSEIPIGVIDDILSHNKAICTKIKELPAVDAKSNWCPLRESTQAYDLEAVVKQLEDASFPITLFGETVLVLKTDKAIEIVRNGGVK